GLSVGKCDFGLDGHVSRGARIGDHTEAVFADREDDEHAFLMPERADLVARDWTGDVNIGEEPVIWVGLAGELHAKCVADGAMSAVATEEPRRVECFFAAVGMTERAGDRIGRFAKRD